MLVKLDLLAKTVAPTLMIVKTINARIMHVVLMVLIHINVFVTMVTQGVAVRSILMTVSLSTLVRTKVSVWIK